MGAVDQKFAFSGRNRDFQTQYQEMEAAGMTLLEHSKYMSGLLSRHAMRGMHDKVGNEDGQLGPVPKELILKYSSFELRETT